MSARIADVKRRSEKEAAILARLAEIHDKRDLLVSMLDEGKLDLLILALGLGAVNLHEEDAP